MPSENFHLPRLHSAPIPGSNLGGGSDPSGGGGGGFNDPRLHSDPAQGADPTSGPEGTISSKKFLLLHMEKFHTLRGQTQLSVYTHKESSVRPHMWGRTLQIWRSNGGAGDLRLH